MMISFYWVLTEDRDIYFYQQILRQKGKRHHDGGSNKLLKEDIPLLRGVVDKYRDKKVIKNEVYLDDWDMLREVGTFGTHSGVGLAYIVWEAVLKIKDFERLEITHPSNWYRGDLDYFSQTDEYKNMNLFWRWVWLFAMPLAKVKHGLLKAITYVTKS